MFRPVAIYVRNKALEMIGARGECSRGFVLICFFGIWYNCLLFLVGSMAPLSLLSSDEGWGLPVATRAVLGSAWIRTEAQVHGSL